MCARRITPHAAIAATVHHEHFSRARSRMPESAASREADKPRASNIGVDSNNVNGIRIGACANPIGKCIRSSAIG